MSEFDQSIFYLFHYNKFNLYSHYIHKPFDNRFKITDNILPIKLKKYFLNRI